MAEVLDEFRFGRAKYPWEEWTDGRIWKIRQGEDFTSEIENMHKYLRRRATMLGCACSVSVDEDAGTLVFQFHRERPPAKTKERQEVHGA